MIFTAIPVWSGSGSWSWCIQIFTLFSAFFYPPPQKKSNRKTTFSSVKYISSFNGPYPDPGAKNIFRSERIRTQGQKRSFHPKGSGSATLLNLQKPIYLLKGRLKASQRFWGSWDLNIYVNEYTVILAGVRIWIGVLKNSDTDQVFFLSPVFHIRVQIPIKSLSIILGIII